MAPVHVRVFLSSPGDVHDERTLARKVIESLPKQPFIRGRATLEVVSWDDPEAPAPVYANLTPQEALRRHLPMPSECDLVIVMLWSRMGTPLPEDDDVYRKPDGERYLSGTEWEFADAARADRAVLLYRRVEKPMVELDDPEREAKAAQYALVSRFIQRFTSRDRSLNGLWREYKKPSEFERLLDNDVRAVLERLLATRGANGEPSTAPEMARRPEQSPYPGLRRLTEQDAAIFFGRGAEVDALIGLIAGGQRFLSVVGASGSGKSSLVRAGLLPRLHGNAVSGSKDWKFVTFTPADLGDNPLLALAAALAPLSMSAAPIQLANAMAADPAAAARLCDTVLSGSPAWAKLAIVVDQLEELFTIAAPGHRESFLRVIDVLASHSRVLVITTMRADFVSDVTKSPRLADLLRDGSYLLMPPGLRALSDIIALPAARAGVTVEAGLLERLVEDAGLQPGTLPLLAYTLEQLYNTGHQTGALTLADYQSLGGIGGAISKRANESLGSVDHAAMAELPRLFRHLLTINAAGIVTRRRARQPDVITGPAAETLVRTLVDARLLIADSRNGENTVEVAHEALFDGWDHMRLWIAENREYLLWRSRLRVRLDDWVASGREESSALQGTALHEALKWLERHADDLSEEERTFIQWPLSDEFQIRGVIRSAREILASAPERLARDGQRKWLVALILAGEEAELASLTKRGSLPASLITAARVGAVVLLARAGELEAALAMAAAMTGPERSESALRIAEIAATTGRQDVAAAAARLVADEQLTRRTLARARACKATGSNCQFTTESLSQVLPSQTVAPPLWGLAPMTFDWPATLARVRSVTSPVLRAGMLASAMNASAASDRAHIAGSLLQELGASLDGSDEGFWHGLLAVRIADALGAAGAFTEAQRVVASMQSAAHRAHARARLARHRILRGEYGEAVGLCRDAFDDVSRSGATEPDLEQLIASATELGRAGRHEDGKRLALATLDVAAAASAASATLLARVAQALAFCDAPTDAVRTLDRIVPKSWRDEAFRMVGRALAAHGHADRVIEFAAGIADPLRQADVLACLAVGGADAVAGRTDVADSIVQALAAGGDRRRSYADRLVRWTGMLICSGRIDALLAAVREVDGKHERLETSLAITEQLVASGLNAEALTLAEEGLVLVDALDDHDQRARAFAHLAGLIARSGRIEESHRTARRCHLRDEQLAALTTILCAWIVRSRYPRVGDQLWGRTTVDGVHKVPVRLAHAPVMEAR